MARPSTTASPNRRAGRPGRVRSLVTSAALAAVTVSAPVVAACGDDDVGRPPEGEERLETMVARCLSLQPDQVDLDLDRGGNLKGPGSVATNLPEGREPPGQDDIDRCLRAVNLDPAVLDG